MKTSNTFALLGWALIGTTFLTRNNDTVIAVALVGLAVFVTGYIVLLFEK